MQNLDYSFGGKLKGDILEDNIELDTVGGYGLDSSIKCGEFIY
jgi:hypothetical protein